MLLPAFVFSGLNTLRTSYSFYGRRISHRSACVAWFVAMGNSTHTRNGRLTEHCCRCPGQNKEQNERADIILSICHTKIVGTCFLLYFGYNSRTAGRTLESSDKTEASTEVRPLNHEMFQRKPSPYRLTGVICGTPNYRKSHRHQITTQTLGWTRGKFG